jgi:2Fe-2S ferredoxin
LGLASAATPTLPSTHHNVKKHAHMVKLTFVEADGTAATLDVPAGWSLMQAATSNGVEGIVGECGGSCACATCHCYVDELLMAVLAPPAAGELEMLENVAAERRSNSRLACQIKASTAMDGRTVSLPVTQE